MSLSADTFAQKVSLLILEKTVKELIWRFLQLKTRYWVALASMMSRYGMDMVRTCQQYHWEKESKYWIQDMFLFLSICATEPLGAFGCSQTPCGLNTLTEQVTVWDNIGFETWFRWDAFSTALIFLNQY